jgi:hypothetical protein
MVCAFATLLNNQITKAGFLQELPFAWVRIYLRVSYAWPHVLLQYFISRIPSFSHHFSQTWLLTARDWNVVSWHWCGHDDGTDVPDLLESVETRFTTDVVFATDSQPDRLYARTAQKHGGVLPPETRLISGMLGGILVPISLIWLAFTTYKSVHWIVPIIASVPFGSGVILIFTSCWTVRLPIVFSSPYT